MDTINNFIFINRKDDMKRRDDIDIITDEITAEQNKNNKKETKKMKLSDKTIKVTTIIKFVIIISLIALSFVAGWNSNTAYNNAHQAEVKASAKALVEDLK